MMTKERKALVDAIIALESQANKVLKAWYAVEAVGDEVPVVWYPFTQSFEEVIADLGFYREKLQEWAK